MEHQREQILFCFCGPGGSGKSTVCSELVSSIKELKLSISTTTRTPRGDEQNGVEYFFVSESEFQEKIKSKQFIEYAEFNNQLYGTEHRNIELAKEQGCDLLLDIDVQGVLQLKKIYPRQLVTIFIFPPSFEILKQRFTNRGTDSKEKIQQRLEIAKDEIATLTSNGFTDYLIINDSLPAAVELAKSIIISERARFARLKTDIFSGIGK